MNAEPTDLQRQNLPARIAALVGEQLMRGDLSPGQPLVLREIAETYGVSQTPVREALLHLVSEGVLTMRTGRSVIVPELSLEDLMELRDIRVEIEALAGRKACKQVDAALIDKLVTYHEAMMKARAEGEVKQALAANKQFHFSIYEKARSPVLLKLIEQFWMRTAPYIGYIYYPNLPDFDKPYARHPHLEIIDALREQNVAGVARWIERDIRQHDQHMASNFMLTMQEKSANPKG